MTDTTKAIEAVIPSWAYFEKIDHEDGKITYESHGCEDEINDDNMEGNTFICIEGHRAKEVAETIRRALKRCEALEWKPIETAPKDGTIVLLAGHKYGKSCNPMWSGAGLCCRGEWVGLNTEDDIKDFIGSFGYATHWQPLPEPPKSQIKGQDNG